MDVGGQYVSNQIRTSEPYQQVGNENGTEFLTTHDQLWVGVIPKMWCWTQLLTTLSQPLGPLWCIHT